jgi:hypothetical protein
MTWQNSNGIVLIKACYRIKKIINKPNLCVLNWINKLQKVFFYVVFWSWVADKLHFILSYEAGFYKPTVLKVHPPFCRITKDCFTHNKKIYIIKTKRDDITMDKKKQKNNFDLFWEEMKKLISVSDCLLEVIKQSNDFISFQDFISFIPLKMLDWNRLVHSQNWSASLQNSKLLFYSYM